MISNWRTSILCGLAAVAMSAAMAPAPAAAEMILSQVIVDLQPGKPGHDDIEVWNSGTERMYVVAEPSEIRSPGRQDEQRVSNPDPSVTGLLVSPQRMVLEPGQRRMVRVSAIIARQPVDRIYRVTIKPVAGDVTAEATAIKVLVGYDVLVLYRPDAITGEVTATRSGRTLKLHNGSNTAQEVFDGKQCDAGGQNCKTLGANRLYAGADWEQALPYDTPVEYRVTAGNGTKTVKF